MLADRWLNLGGTWYTLSASGAMRTGWYQEGSARYWLDPETGAMAVGRCTIDGREYVFSGSGAMVNNVWVSLGNGSCGFIDGSGDAVLVASYDAQAESYVLMGRRAGAQPLERPSISIRRTKARCVRACSTSMEFVTTPTLRASGKRDGSKPPERGITWIPRAGSCAPVGLPWAVLGTISILRRGLCRPVGCRRAVIGIT